MSTNRTVENNAPYIEYNGDNPISTKWHHDPNFPAFNSTQNSQEISNNAIGNKLLHPDPNFVQGDSISDMFPEDPNMALSTRRTEYYNKPYIEKTQDGDINFTGEYLHSDDPRFKFNPGELDLIKARETVFNDNKTKPPRPFGSQVADFITDHPDATKYAGYGAAALGVAGLAYGGYKLIKDVYDKYNWKHSGCNSIEDVSSRTKCQLYLYDSKIADLKHSIKQCKDETCIKQIQDEITKNLEFKDKLSVGE